jgi:hypothetical protein
MAKSSMPKPQPKPFKPLKGGSGKMGSSCKKK